MLQGRPGCVVRIAASAGAGAHAEGGRLRDPPVASAPPASTRRGSSPCPAPASAPGRCCRSGTHPWRRRRPALPRAAAHTSHCVRARHCHADSRPRLARRLATAAADGTDAAAYRRPWCHRRPIGAVGCRCDVIGRLRGPIGARELCLRMWTAAGYISVGGRGGRCVGVGGMVVCTLTVQHRCRRSDKKVVTDNNNMLLHWSHGNRLIEGMVYLQF